MNKCLYPDCESTSTSCRATEESEYYYHSSYNDECTGPGDHKWICDNHWKLIEFLKDVLVLESIIKVK